MTRPGGGRWVFGMRAVCLFHIQPKTLVALAALLNGFPHFRAASPIEARTTQGPGCGLSCGIVEERQANLKQATLIRGEPRNGRLNFFHVPQQTLHGDRVGRCAVFGAS